MVEVCLVVPENRLHEISWIRSQTDPDVVAEALRLSESAYVLKSRRTIEALKDTECALRRCIDCIEDNEECRESKKTYSWDSEEAQEFLSAITKYRETQRLLSQGLKHPHRMYPVTLSELKEHMTEGGASFAHATPNALEAGIERVKKRVASGAAKTRIANTARQSPPPSSLPIEVIPAYLPGAARIFAGYNYARQR